MAYDKQMDSGAYSLTETMIEGVRVESVAAFPGTVLRLNPIVYVHGGGQGSWAFSNYLPFFASRGWSGYALNWYEHNGSSSPPLKNYLKRGIADLVEEIHVVTETLKLPAVLIGHSMGGLAVQKYAEQYPVAALVLIAAVTPTEAGVPSEQLPVDMDQPYPTAPFDVVHKIFLDGLNESEARMYYEKMVPESPRCVADAFYHAISVDRERLHCPILAIGAEQDPLVPADHVKAMADYYGADYRRIPDRGHNLMLEGRWEETAAEIAAWLGHNCSKENL